MQNHISGSVRDRLDAVVTALRSTVASLADPPIGLAEHERLAQRLLQGELCENLPYRAYAELVKEKAATRARDTQAGSRCPPSAGDLAQEGDK